ncbi:hypothetical protein DSCO28_70890 [Desulfosarcina ovata subsp. sediminis]|uniref:PEP-CTERM protein-sorting domain-containing protein n=1 Tax=Desulfosarcina ovata subsp. sediminis TaxID=885957 RepID=A0A5K8A1U5_9BACT|nr:VPLPA-CTERM sorting domain-containing protein [Desulfosarcina ovata]BBO86523.1 hypothetical protein DSCO28_70890 [Desulfosarcina ovata subsp. sediminis]
MKKKSVILSFVIGLCFFIATAQASIIEQTEGTAGRGLEFYDPGQTFTAEDPLLEAIEFELSCSTILEPASSLQVDLYTWDVGTNSLGTLVASSLNSSELPVYQGGFSWVTFDFSGTTLTTGEQYAVVIFDPDDDLWGYVVRWNSSNDLYDEGSALFNASFSAHEPLAPDANGYDLNFRVTAAPVPIPAAVWLLGGGLLGLIGIRRRSARK